LKTGFIVQKYLVKNDNKVKHYVYYFGHGLFNDTLTFIYINYVAFNGYENEKRMLLYDTVPPFVGRSEISKFPQSRRDGIWLRLDKLSLLQDYIIRNPKS
jgi:hypothetical protein